jgi:WD40 repeat protein
LPNGRVLVVGGGYTDNAAELFDPSVGTWTATGALNIGRELHTATLLPNGKVLVTGGYNSNGYLSSAELYDPASGSWSLALPMGTARFYHTATLLPNGKVLVAGGNGAEPAAELYDPATGTWTPTGDLITKRDSHSATLLPDGGVLVAGGYGAAAYTGATEFYNPAAGTWIAGTTLSNALNFHTATLLPNGQILFVGGYGGTNGTFPAAQLYDVGLGFDSSWRPQIDNITSPLAVGSRLTLVGSGFRGISEASSGYGFQSSPANYPIVQLRSIENERMVVLSSSNYSAIFFTSAPVSDLPPGWTLATMFVNGIPSLSRMIRVTTPALAAPTIANLVILTNGSFQFSFTSTPGALFSVLASTNPALPLNSWTEIGSAPEISPGRFQFIDPQASNFPQRLYRVSSP